MNREHFRILMRFINLLKVNHRRNPEEETLLFANLRRCCHILDKGIHVAPFEKGHSKSIYKEAINIKNKLDKSNTRATESPSYKWCNDVLSLYEKAQENGESLAVLNPLREYNIEDQKFIRDFLESRVSCRIFNNETIEDSVWENIISLTQSCPNSCCRQTTKVYIIKNKEIIEKTAPLLGGATCFSNGIPYLVCFTSQIGAYSDKDVMLTYIDSSIFAGTFVIAARAYNIQSVILNYQHAYLDHDGIIHNFLGIPKDELITLFCACGRVDFVPLKPYRLSVNDILKFV